MDSAACNKLDDDNDDDDDYDYYLTFFNLPRPATAAVTYVTSRERNYIYIHID